MKTRRAFLGLSLSLVSGSIAVACSGQVSGVSGPVDSGVDAPATVAPPPPPPPPVDAAHPVDAPPPVDANAPVDAPPPVDGAVPSMPPPPADGGGVTSSTEEHDFAVATLYLGDVTRQGTPSPSAWQSFGYDLDGKVTTSASTDVCTLEPGAPRSSQVDGVGGIDNSFGENILPILLTVAGSDFASKIDAAIVAGQFTLLFDVTGLADANASQTATGLSGFFEVGGVFDPSGHTAPTFTKADSWPVDPTSLTNPLDARSSRYPFSAPYVVGGTFVSGAPSTLVVPILFGGAPLDLTIHEAVVTFDHHAPGQAAAGTIAGVLDPTEFVAALRAVAGHLSTSLCSGQAFNSIALQIAQAQDILGDGTNQVGVACDAISIGLGFTGAEIGLPTKVAPATVPPPDPCSD